MASAAERQKTLRDRRRQNGDKRQFNIWLRAAVFELIQNQAKSLGVSQAALVEETIVKEFGDHSMCMPVVNLAPSSGEGLSNRQNVSKAISPVKLDQDKKAKATQVPKESTSEESSQGELF